MNLSIQSKKEWLTTFFILYILKVKRLRSFLQCHKRKNGLTCQYKISWTAEAVGTPSGHIGITIYTEKRSFALILLAIFRASSIGTKLSAPVITPRSQTHVQKMWWRYCKIFKENEKLYIQRTLISNKRC